MQILCWEHKEGHLEQVRVPIVPSTYTPLCVGCILYLYLYGMRERAEPEEELPPSSPSFCVTSLCLSFVLVELTKERESP